MSAPIFVFFGLFSFKNGGGEPNWPIVCYLSGAILGVGWLAEQLQSPSAGGGAARGRALFSRPA